MSLDAKWSVDLVLLLGLLVSIAPSVAIDIRSLPTAPGYIRSSGRGLRSSGRGLRAGGCRSHAPEDRPLFEKSLNTNGFMGEK
jgi:hypothetical protein